MSNIPDGSAMLLNVLAYAAHKNAVAHGFYEDHLALREKVEGSAFAVDEAERTFILAQIAKISGECGEAVSAIQHGEPVKEVATELADVIIRTLDLGGYLGVEMGDIIIEKMKHNETRPYKHGKVC